MTHQELEALRRAAQIAKELGALAVIAGPMLEELSSLLDLVGASSPRAPSLVVVESGASEPTKLVH